MGSANRESQTQYPEHSDELDAMGTIGSVDNEWEMRGSSAAAFVEQVKAALAAKLSSPGFLDRGSPGKKLSLLYDGSSLAQAFVLPSRRVADEMMALYWKEVHILYPFLLPRQLMEAYRRLWVGELEQSKERKICALLNIMFAICCRMSRSLQAETKDEEADMYFQRAIKIVQLEMLGPGSVELLQTLLLLVLYLQSTQWQQSCWVVTGLAIRVAQGMGLHLPDTSARSHTQAERQLARRLWHGCVLVDRIVSMTLGRPQTISQEDAMAVALPVAIDDEHLSIEPGKENIQPRDSPSTMCFYLETLKLFMIQTKTLSQMYPYHASLEKVHFGAIITLDSALQEWSHDLPDHLKARTHPVNSHMKPVFVRQSNILHLRHLQAQILLLRPVVSLLMTQGSRATIATAEASNAHPLWLTMANACTKNCICAALSVIDLIHNEHVVDQNPPQDELLPAWWFELFFLYTAATAIIPARVFSHVRGIVSPGSLAEAWQRALAVLSHLSERSSTAKRCLAVLQYIGDHALASEDVQDTQKDKHDFVPFPQSDNTFMATASFSASTTDSQNLLGGGGTEELLDFAWLDSLPAGFDSGWFDGLEAWAVA